MSVNKDFAMYSINDVLEAIARAGKKTKYMLLLLNLP